MELFDLSGQVAVVTGASHGIGRAIGERMAEHGARVVFSSRSLEVCQARADAVKRPHDEDVDSRARGRRNPPRLAAPAQLPDLLASDLDVPARGSAHTPTRRRV